MLLIYTSLGYDHNMTVTHLSGYFYEGVVALCCSSPDPTEVGVQQSQAALMNQLSGDYKTTFGEQQSTLQSLQAQMEDNIAHPKGLGGQELSTLRTNAMDQNSRQFSQAKAAAGAAAATHGGADTSSGVTAQVEGALAGDQAQSEAQSQGNISLADANAKNTNYWNAINGLQQVGAAYNPTSYAGQSEGAAGQTTSASQAILAEKQAGWQNAMGIVKGVAGLAGGIMTGGLSTAVSGMMSHSSDEEADEMDEESDEG